MTNTPKGGRGRKVPYQTCTVRIPAAIRDQVDRMASQYRASVIEGSEFSYDLGHPTLDQAIMLAKKVLKQKRSAKYTIINLLQVMYNTKLTEKDFD